ncbi:hypothetical protein D3C85_1781400 [compost metagenome]
MLRHAQRRQADVAVQRVHTDVAQRQRCLLAVRISALKIGGNILHFEQVAERLDA